MAAMTAIGMAMPIAAASIVGVSLFAWAWKGNQYDRAKQKSPWYFQISLVSTFLIFGFFVYWLRNVIPQTYLQIFGAAMIGQMFAVMFLFGLSNVIWVERSKPIRQRIFPALATLVIAVLILSGAFTG
ncbi:hypothetical protein [Methylobacterium variabile]|jgi:hypothetical protein|uniref:hypothetical protein n=1 Tax=Methylobacterium variabile TaxID=298794 RepID=UPI000A692CC7|nr:hypothetical protein [Methylobacterium variabile]